MPEKSEDFDSEDEDFDEEEFIENEEETEKLSEAVTPKQGNEICKSGLSDIDIPPIRHRGYLQELFFHKDKVATYAKNRVALGRDKKGNRIVIDFSRSIGVLIIGARGSGKSFLIRGIMDRAHKANILPVISTDLKPEYHSSREPVQEEFEQFIDENEQGEPLPLKIYYPKFLEHFTRTKQKIEYSPIQLSFENTTLFDFLTIIGKTISDAQLTALEMAFKLKEQRKIRSFEELLKYIEKSKDIDAKTIRALRAAINNLLGYEVFGEVYDFNLIECINNNCVPILNLYGWMSLGQFAQIPAAYVALFIRNILTAKQQKQIKPSKKIIVVVDEAPRFVPATESSNLSSRKEILDCLDLGRSYGISMIFSTQSTSRIPISIIEQCRYVLLPYNIDLESMVDIFKRKGIEFGASIITFRHELTKIRNKMKLHDNGSRDWMIIDTEMKTYKIFAPFAPLSAHLTESE